jgi:hypothetical protein
MKIVPLRSLHMNAVLPHRYKQHMAASTDSVQLNRKLRLGRRTGNNAGWQGVGAGREAAAWPSRDYFHTCNSRWQLALFYPDSLTDIIDLASSWYRIIVTSQSQKAATVHPHQALEIGNASRCTVLAAWNDFVRLWSLSQKYVHSRQEPTRTDNKNTTASRKPGRDMQTPSTSVTETVKFSFN